MAEGFIIYVKPSIFGPAAPLIARQGASRWPQYAWTVAEGETEWPDQMPDWLWAAQQWLHDEHEAAVGHTVDVEPAAAAQAPEGSSGSALPSEPERVHPGDLVARQVVELLEQIGPALAAYVKTRPAPARQPFLVQVGRGRLVALLEEQARRSEEQAGELEAEAAKVEVEITFCGLPEVMAPAPEPRKSRGAAAAAADADAAAANMQRAALENRLHRDAERAAEQQRKHLRRLATSLRITAEERRIIAAGLTEETYRLTWEDLDRLSGRAIPMVGALCGPVGI